MANAREIQSRMKSIKDTMKITNAMYMISSSKLSKARTDLKNTEPYFFTMQDALAKILMESPDAGNRFFDQRPDLAPEDRKKGYIVVTADKGMAGAYNHNILKLAEEHIQNNKNAKLYVIGEIGRHYFQQKKIPIAHQFHYTIQNPTLSRARNISETLIDAYRTKKVDEIYLVYTSMKNAMTEEAQFMRLLPLERPDFMIKDIPVDLPMEHIAMKPSPEAVMGQIVPDYIVGYIYSALVEAYASEQNARLMAMQAAADNASAILQELGTLYNRARQAAITQEITEVIAGAKAQKKGKN